MDITRFYRQLKMMVGIGRVTGFSDAGAVQTMQYRTPLDVRSDTPRMTEFGFSSAPPVGSDVVVVSLGGDRSSQVIISTNHKESRHTGLDSGQTVIYNHSGQFVKLTDAGIVVEANGQPVTVSNSTTVTITGTDEVIADTPVFRCTGDIIDNSGKNSTTLKQLRDAYNKHDHFVESVASGDLTVQSDPPGETV